MDAVAVGRMDAARVEFAVPSPNMQELTETTAERWGLHSYYRYTFLIDVFPFLLISNGVYSVSTNLMLFLFWQVQGKIPRPVAL